MAKSEFFANLALAQPVRTHAPIVAPTLGRVGIAPGSLSARLAGKPVHPSLLSRVLRAIAGK